MENNLCPCGKDVTNRLYQFHKYRCPKKEKKVSEEGIAAGSGENTAKSGPRTTNKATKSDKLPLRSEKVSVTPKTTLEHQKSHPSQTRKSIKITTASEKFPSKQGKAEKVIFLLPKAENQDVPTEGFTHLEPLFKDLGVQESSCKGYTTKLQSPGLQKTPSPSRSRTIIDVKELDDIVERMITEGVIKTSKNPQNDVQEFFDEEVKLCQSEISSVRPHINILREKIIGRLNVETNLGGWEYRNAGSSADGTKVSRLNEMDCIMHPRVSKHMKAVFDESCIPGFCKVKVVGDVEDTDVGMFLDGDFLNSRKFREFVFQKLESIVEGDRKLKDARKFPQTISFAIKYKAIPTESGMISVDVDFVPSIEIGEWPMPHYARNITQVLGDTDKAETIKSHGFNAIPKHCTWGPKESQDLLWQMSFSYAEKDITKYGEKKCWKPVMRTLKRIVEVAKGEGESTRSSKGRQLIQIQRAAEYARRSCSPSKRLSRDSPDPFLDLRFSTYHIRTLMWTLRYDVTIGGHVWIEDTQANRLRTTLQHFQRMMSGESIIPHFFIPTLKNIMDGISTKERKYLYVVAKAAEIIFSNRCLQ